MFLKSSQSSYGYALLLSSPTFKILCICILYPILIRVPKVAVATVPYLVSHSLLCRSMHIGELSFAPWGIIMFLLTELKLKWSRFGTLNLSPKQCWLFTSPHSSLCITDCKSGLCKYITHLSWVSFFLIVPGKIFEFSIFSKICQKA